MGAVNLQRIKTQFFGIGARLCIGTYQGFDLLHAERFTKGFVRQHQT